MKRFVTFVRSPGDLKEGRMRLFIRDLTPGKRKYNAQHVLANLSRQEGPAELLVRTGTGTEHQETWFIEILETLDNFVHGRPYGQIIHQE